MPRVTFYVVFLLPVLLSFVFGGAVLALQDHEGGYALFGSEQISILGLESAYSASDPVSIRISADDSFDCGDLYISIYNSATGELVRQAGFFDQCFVRADSDLPLGDDFSEVITIPGSYEVKADMINELQQASVRGQFSVG